MTGKVLELSNVITPDLLATRLTERWIQWDTLRNVKKVDWEEIRRYVYATDTTQTTNNQFTVEKTKPRYQSYVKSGTTFTPTIPQPSSLRGSG